MKNLGEKIGETQVRAIKIFPVVAETAVSEETTA